MTNQDVGIVTKQFEHQLRHYTSEKRGAGTSPVVSFLADAYSDERSVSDELRICEFGGADGLMLAAIRERLGPRVRATNAELVDAFATTQADPSIEFVRTSILDSSFADMTFDVVIARHVLHHLVTDSHLATRANQRAAFAELLRVTRIGGWVLIEEHVNPSALACRILYVLSRLATRIGISIPAFEVTPYTVVAFLTPNQLLDAASAATAGRLAKRADGFQPVKLPIQWRLTRLRRGSGNLFVAFRVLAH